MGTKRGMAAGACFGAGHWVERPGPPPPPLVCPVLFSRISAYVRNARQRERLCCTEIVQQQLLQNLSYASCDGRVLSATQLLDGVGLNVAFLGDSAMNQLFEAIMYALYDAGVPLTLVSRSGSEDQRPELYERDAACSLRQKRPAKGGSELHLSLRHGQPCAPSHYVRRAAQWEACAHLPAAELWVGAPPTGAARDTRSVLRFWRVDKADDGPAARRVSRTSPMPVYAPTASCAHRRAPTRPSSPRESTRRRAARTCYSPTWASTTTVATRRRAPAMPCCAYRCFRCALCAAVTRALHVHCVQALGLADYQRALRTLFARLAPMRGGFFVETFPQHFHTRSGSGLYAERVDNPRCQPGCRQP